MYLFILSICLIIVYYSKSPTNIVIVLLPTPIPREGKSNNNH